MTASSTGLGWNNPLSPSYWHNSLDPTSLLPDGQCVMKDYECVLCKKFVRKGDSHEHGHRPNKNPHYASKPKYMRMPAKPKCKSRLHYLNPVKRGDPW